MEVFIDLSLALLGGALLLPVGVVSLIAGKPPRAVGLVLTFLGTTLLIQFGDSGLLTDSVNTLVGMLAD